MKRSYMPEMPSAQWICLVYTIVAFLSSTNAQETFLRRNALTEADKTDPLYEFKSSSNKKQLNFHLNDENVFSACQLIESQFATPVQCSCSLLPGSSAISYGCTTMSHLCEDIYCYKPSYVGTVSEGGPLHVSQICLRHLRIASSEKKDICVSVLWKKSHDNSHSFDRCLATFGKNQCQCEICHETGIRLDCSNLLATAVSTRCDTVPLINSIDGETDFIDLFRPSFLAET
jgi:hypothetical protein